MRSANYNVVIGETEADVEDRLQFYGELLRKGGVADAKAAASVEDLRKQPASARRTRSSRCSRTWRRAG